MNGNNPHAMARTSGAFPTQNWASVEACGQDAQDRRARRRPSDDTWPIWWTAVPVTIFCAAVWAGIFYLIASL